ncbi:hypothetical protein MTR67_006597 [Solanum verrucosum]|uniref:Reverse transcriptase zinc-binding domain-containing protein n=1 Tax=Solanum verrucosum TaxID=315347 RepID=A0AAF0PYC9_SOLVR|nr:hypothetical protein MTR67_006597 [Solanum verrucosum]
MRTTRRPIQVVSTWVRRQPPKVKAFLAVITGMAALVLLRAIVHDHDNLFVAAEAVHSIGISVLIYKLMKEKTCAGDGGKTLFWEEVWAGQASLKASFPELFSLSLQKVATVKEMRDAQGWNLKFRRPLNDWEVNRMVEFLNILERYKELSNREDKLLWAPDTQGRFSVGTAYRNSQRTHTQSSYWPWKMIWKVKVPFKVACFTWLLAKQVVLTQDNRMKKGLDLCSRCFFCECETETINHLFLHCKETVKLWQIFINKRGISWSMPGSIKEALACWNRDGNQSGHRERWKIVPACIWWTIWLERNQRCFEDKSCSMEKMKLKCLALFYFWCKHEYPHEDEDITSLSLKSQELTAMFLAVRLYCSFVMEYDIHTLLDLATLATTLWVIYMIRFNLRSSYMEDKDNFLIYYVVIPCAALALLIHPSTSHFFVNRVFWAFCVYLEAVSVLPQLRVMQNTKIVEPFTAHYVFALGVARFLSCAHWVLQVLDSRGHLLVALGYGLWPSMVLISEIVQTFILADFCYYYVKSVFGGQLVMRLPSGVV